MESLNEVLHLFWRFNIWMRQIWLSGIWNVVKTTTCHRMLWNNVQLHPWATMKRKHKCEMPAEWSVGQRLGLFPTTSFCVSQRYKANAPKKKGNYCGEKEDDHHQSKEDAIITSPRSRDHHCWGRSRIAWSIIERGEGVTIVTQRAAEKMVVRLGR